MGKILDYVINSTAQYMEHIPKKQRKSYGQFFTSKETAQFMAGLFNVPADKTEIAILDPGAGSGSDFNRYRYYKKFISLVMKPMKKSFNF